MLVRDDHKYYRESLLAILAGNQLPVNDIKDATILFAWINDKEVVGTAGWEQFENDALVRSISIKPGMQQKGIGSSLYAALEKAAIDAGIQNLYLLTTTADRFFQKQGFSVITRDDVPASIRNNVQFTSTCPASAIVMQKLLTQ